MAAPDDPQALAAVRRERGRAGRCPECVAPVITRSTLLLDDAAACWPCYFKVGLERLRRIIRARASELLVAPEEKIVWGIPGDGRGADESPEAPGRRLSTRAVAFAVGRALKGRFPAVCDADSPQTALGRFHSIRPRVYERGRPHRELYPACVAHRLQGVIVVGYYMGFRGVDDDELGRTWPILEKKQEMHGNAYVVAHGRPCYEKNLRQRMTAWAEASATHLDGPLADFRMVAPVTAWRAWTEERQRLRRLAAEKIRSVLADFRSCDGSGA